jgi:F-type H+-transporting ATPase subunit b
MIEYIIPIAHAAEAAQTEAQTGLLGTFGINWKFFIAQLINFSIVVFIFWKWALTPVAKKLTERTERITIALKDAERIQEEKKEFDEWKAEEMKKVRSEAAEVISKATSEAEAAKAAILAKTKEDQEKMILQAKNQIASDQERSMAEIKGQVADMVTKATEKIIKQKLDGAKDQEIIKQTIKNL